MTALARILIALGGGYYFGEKKFLHCVAVVLTVVFLRGVIGDFDPSRFIATHQYKIIQRYEHVLEASDDDW